MLSNPLKSLLSVTQLLTSWSGCLRHNLPGKPQQPIQLGAALVDLAGSTLYYRQKSGKILVSPVKYLMMLFLLVSLFSPAYGATINAASCAAADVQAAINLAADGDTVIVPAGSCSWTSRVTISRAIHLVASGTVTITDNDTAAETLITLIESPAGSIRLSGFTFVAGAGPNCEFGDAIVGMFAATNGQPILVDHNTFQMGITCNCMRAATNQGVIWSNTFTGQILGAPYYFNNAAALRHKLGSSNSWVTPSTFGTADTNGNKHLYFEQNTLTLLLEGIDVDSFARTVIRYNTFQVATITHHDITSGTGPRYSEIYNNHFVWNPALGGQDLPPNMSWWIFLRGGTSLIHDNIFDLVSSPAWGTKGGIGFTDENPRRFTAFLPCWNLGYPSPQQVGWGYITGGTQAGSTGIFMDSEPVYLWNNSGTGGFTPGVIDYNCASGDACFAPDTARCLAQPSALTYVVQNKDYYLNTAKPGYTPYTYPHPLAGNAAVPNSPQNLRTVSP